MSMASLPSDVANAFLWICIDADGFVNCSDAFHEYLGYSKSQLRGGAWTRCISTSDRLTLAQELFEALAGQAEINRIITLTTLSRKTTYARLTTFLSQSERTLLYLVLVDCTKTIQNQRNLEESNRRMHDILEGLPVPAWATDAQFSVYYANRRLLEYTGLSEEDSLGDSMIDLVCEEQKDLLVATQSALRENPVESELVLHIHAKGRGYRKNRVFIAPLREESGILTGWICSSVDVEEQEATKENLEKRELFLKKLTQSVPDVIYLYDLDLDTNVYANRSLFDVLGYTAEEIQGMGSELLPSIIHPEDFERIKIEKANRRFLSENELNLVEYRMRKSDGRYVWLESREVAFERRADGQVKVILGIASDITMRKQMDIAKTSHIRVLEHAIEGVAILNDKGQFVYVNNSLSSLLGVCSLELIGQSWFSFFKHDELFLIAEAASRLVESDSVSHETSLITRTGKTLFVRLTMIPHYDDEEALSGFYCFIHDDTATRTLSTQIESQLLELADAQVQLELHRVDLEATNHRLSQLAATDGLTSLANHRRFQSYLSQLVAEETRLSILLLDVDDFKSYNDTFGHQAGDEVLRKFSNILKNNVSGDEMAARYGGEEFVILLPGLEEESARMRAEQIRKTVEDEIWPNRAITVSVGVATWKHGQHRAELIENADTALYQAKRLGRNRVAQAA